MVENNQYNDDLLVLGSVRLIIFTGEKHIYAFLTVYVTLQVVSFLFLQEDMSSNQKMVRIIWLSRAAIHTSLNA